MKTLNCTMAVRGLWGWLMVCAFAGRSFAAGPGINFVENKGQWPECIRFSARVSGAVLNIGEGSFNYIFLDQGEIEARHHGNPKRRHKEGGAPEYSAQVRGHLLAASFLGFNEQSQPRSFGQMPQYYNYFLGSDRKKWQSNAHAYAGMIYPDFYDGIDLKVYSEESTPKYDFIVEPGADPSVIRWKYDGAESITLHDGDLTVKTSLADLIEKKPIAYQVVDGKRIYVRVAYCLEGSEISFHLLEDFDPCLSLVIDPALIFSTYSGSSADNWGSTATPGEHGMLYSSGITNLVDAGGSFPATPGAFQTNYGGIFDVALLKYDSAGHQLLYASYLGGQESETPHSLVIDKDENLLVLGTTSSLDFPTTSGAISENFAGGVPLGEASADREAPIPYERGADIFVAKISKDGSTLLAGTYLGGSKNDGLNPIDGILVQNYGDQMRGDIISDDAGNIFISSVTSSSDFPITQGFDVSYNGGGTDALIVKLSGDLTQLIWGTFLGGSADDASHTIKLDAAGNIFVAGGTASSNFPITSGTYQTTFGGQADGWIAKISSDGTAVLTSTYTGTSSFDEVFFLDLDNNGNVFVYGQTNGNFPITSGAYHNNNSGQFVQKFNNALSSVLFSTVFGSGVGVPNISPTAFLVSECNSIYLAGWGGEINYRLGYWNSLSSTTGMPVTPDALQKTTSGSDFYFMVLSADGSKLQYATFLGGSDSRTHVDGGTCRFDRKGVVYHVVCSGCSAFNATGHATSDFPTTINAWSRFNGSRNCNNAAFKLDLSSLKAIIQTNTLKFNHPGITKACTNDKIVFQNLSIGGQTYSWNLGDGTLLTKADTTYIPHQYKVAGQYNVQLKATDTKTCIGKDSTATTMYIFDPLGSVGPDQTICYNAGTTLLASGGAAYHWSDNDKFNSASAAPHVDPLKTTSYYVTVTDINGCVVKDTLNVQVIPNIDLKFKAQQVFECEGRPVVNVTNSTDPQEDVFFDFGDGTTSDQQLATHQYAADGKYNVHLVGKKDFCTYDTTVAMSFYYRKVPNVFTPEDSPGVNDTFVIQYGDQKIVPGADTPIPISLVIYNRWGKLVYQNSRYKNDWAGKNVEGGVYYFEATFSGEITCKGWVDVLK